MKTIVKSFLLFCTLVCSATAWADNWVINNDDYSNKIGNWEDAGASLGSGWHNFGGTVTRGGVVLTEWWRGTGPGAGDNKIMKQNISGLPQGYYTVEIYAHTLNSGTGGTLGAAASAVYANSSEVGMTMLQGESDFTPTLRTIDAEVGADGKLEIGIKNYEAGPNWFMAAIKSITYRGTTRYGYTDAEGTWWSIDRGSNPGLYGACAVQMRENYKGDATLTGEMLTKTVNVPNGYYNVSLYAAASYTPGRGFDSPAADGEGNRSFVFAGSQSASMPVVYRSSLGASPDIYNFYNVKVTDGTLKVGVRNDEGGSNWQLLAIKSIQAVGDRPDYSHLLPQHDAGAWDSGEGYTNFGYKEVGKYMGNSASTSAGTVMSGSISGLPVGLYEFTVNCTASWADWSESMPVADGSDDCTVIIANNVRYPIQVFLGRQPSAQQTHTISDIPVDESGKLNVSVVNEKAGANWITFSAHRLVWTGTDTRLQATSLRKLIAQAQMRTNDLMPESKRTDLTNAITSGIALVGEDDNFTVTTTGEELDAAYQALQTAMTAIDTWTAEWENAKKPLAQALERFEADYNDGANGALQKMSQEAWATLVTAAGVAATAKDQYEDLAALGTAASTFNAAMDATDASITLYKKYEMLMALLDAYRPEFNATATYDIDSYKATDATVQGAINDMDAAFKAYVATLEGNQDVTSFAGENMSFEMANGEKLNGNAYKQPGWEITYNYGGSSGNKQYETFTTQSSDMPTGVAGQSLRMRNRWASSNGIAQITKTFVLPSGAYGLSAWIKYVKATTGSLCYYEVDGKRTNLTVPIGSWEKISNNIEIDAPAIITISLGTSGGNDMDIYADEITLTLFNKSAYERAHDAAVEAKAAAGTSESVALASALAEYEKATQAEATAAGYDIATATAVLKNAVAIAEAGDVATGLLKNADFTGGTSETNSGGKGMYPAEWTFTRDLEGWNDCNVNNGVFNMWAGTIKSAELKQQMTNLPDGIYEVSAEFSTNRFGGKSGIGIFADGTGTETGRSVDIGTYSDTEGIFVPYSAFVRVKGHKMNVGIYSNLGYYQTKNIQVKMLPDNEENSTKVTNSVMYQDICWSRGELEYDIAGNTRYTNASNADIRPMLNEPNALITAKDGQIKAGDNLIVGGVCDNLVLTDGAPFHTTKAFTATAATYTRTMPTYKDENDEDTDCTWGTVMLPYAVSSTADMQYYILTNVSEGESGWMHFTEVSELPANTPGVFIAGAKDAVMEGSGTVAASPAELPTFNTTNAAAAWTLHGTLEKKVIDDVTTDTDNEYYYIANEKFWHATKKLTINPFRAYFTVPKAVGGSVRTFSLVVDESDPTAIRLVPTTDAEQTIYTLSGVRIQGKAENLKPGVYIINNKKTVVK